MYTYHTFIVSHKAEWGRRIGCSVRCFYPNFLPSSSPFFFFKPRETHITVWWFSWPPLTPSFSYMLCVPNKSLAGLIVLWIWLYPGKLIMWLKLIRIVFAFPDFQPSNHCFELSFQNSNIWRRSHYLSNMSVLWHYYKEMVSFVITVAIFVLSCGSFVSLSLGATQKMKAKKMGYYLVC